MPPTTIALDLERDRLLHRLERLETVLAALRDRAIYRHAVTGCTPVPLRQAIQGFELEIAAFRGRLDELSLRPAAV